MTSNSHSAETWVINGVLCTQNAQRSAQRASLRIVEGRIAEILPTPPQKFSPAAKVIDASGLTLIPGLIHAHLHLCQSLFRNMADDLELLDWLTKRIWVLEGAHTEETLYTSALLGIHELLSSGATCILDMGTVRHTHAVLEAVKDTGIRASVGKCLMDNPDQTPTYLRRRDERGTAGGSLSLYEKWNGVENDRIRVSYAPRFAISCTEELLKEVSHLSHQQGALVHTHASENQKEIELVRQLFQKENIEYFHHLGLTSSRLVLAHCIWLNAAEKQILRQTGTHVVHCPARSQASLRIAAVPELRSSDQCSTGSRDGTPWNNNLNLFQEMRLAALIHKLVPDPPPQGTRSPGHGNPKTAQKRWDGLTTLEASKARKES